MNKISSTGAIKLFDAFKKSEIKYSQIYLNGNPIGDDCIQSLGEFIQSNRSLEVVGIGDSLTDNGIEALLNYISSNTSVKHLYLEGNKGITNASVKVLDDIIKNSKLEEVGVCDTLINKEYANSLPLVKNVLYYYSLKFNGQK